MYKKGLNLKPGHQTVKHKKVDQIKDTLVWACDKHKQQ
jgi:hypothetical protein